MNDVKKSAVKKSTVKKSAVKKSTVKSYLAVLGFDAVSGALKVKEYGYENTYEIRDVMDGNLEGDDFFVEYER
jgi:hypothetical protein